MAAAGDTIRTMIFARSTVSRQGRWIASVLVAALLLMQFALAAYACPKLDSATHAALMQKAGMAMEDAVGMPSMPDCHAMAGTMDEQDPQLCRAHCDGDSLSSPSLQGLDLQALGSAEDDFLDDHRAGVGIDPDLHEQGADSRGGAQFTPGRLRQPVAEKQRILESVLFPCRFGMTAARKPAYVAVQQPVLN